MPVLTPKYRHRQRAPAVRVRLHRQPHREPDQPGPRAQDPLLPAGRLPVDRLRRAGGRGAGGWSSAARASGRRSRAAPVRGRPNDEPLRRELADFVERRARSRRAPLVDRRGRAPRAGAGAIASELQARRARHGPIRHANVVMFDGSVNATSSPTSTSDGELARDHRAGQPRPRDLPPSPTASASRRAAARRCCSSGRPASTMPVAINLFGSMERMCLALGVEDARRPRAPRSRS